MQPKQFVTFLAGVVSAFAFLVYCGGENPRDSVQHARAANDGGTSSNGGSESVSGSRLKVMRTGGADDLNAVISGTYYDSQFETECRSLRLSDGKTHCAPGVQGFFTYADSKCTQPQFTITYPSCDSPPTFGLTFDSEQCFGVVVYQLAGRKEKGAPIYVKGSDNSCSDYTQAYPDVAVFSSATELQPGAFVELSRTHD